MANEIGVDIVLNGDEALRTLKAIEQGIDKFSRSSTEGVKKVDNSFSVFKGTLGTFAAINFADFIKTQVADAVKAFKEFETGLIGVAKTTDLNGKSLELFEKGINELTSTLPVASKELLSIAQAAGQLGVKGTANLLNFTETIAKLGKSSDVSGEEAATALTRILNVTGESVEGIDELASVVVSLGNNFAATESEIIRVTNEVARATQQFGVSSTEASAFGAVLRSFGVRAEEAGSAVGKSFRAIEEAITTGGKALEQLSKLTGLSGAELKKQFGEDAVGVFQKFLVGLDNAKNGGAVLAQELKKLGLEGETIQKVIPTLSSNYEELTRALSLANEETKNATALNKEFARFAESSENKTQLLANAFEKLQRNIGAAFAPAINSATDSLADFINILAGDGDEVFIKNNKNVEALTGRINQLKNIIVAINNEEYVDPNRENRITKAKEEIEKLNKALGEARTTDYNTEIQALQDQLKALDAQAQLPIKLNFEAPDVGAGVLLPNAAGIDERKAEIEEKIANLRQQIALENNALVEDNAATQQKITDDTAGKVKERIDILAEFRKAEAEQKVAEKATELSQEQIDADTRLQFLVENLGKENAERELARIAQIEGEAKRNDELKKLNDKAREQERAGILKRRDFEDLTNKEKIAAQKDTLAAISTLSQSSNSALFAIGKASSIALAGINVAEGVTKALAAFPPPFNFAAAAAVGAAGAVQIARIATSKPPSAGSFAEGGIIGGSSQTGDRLSANVNAGEVIFNKRQQENLFNAVNSGDLGGGGGVNVTIQGDFLSSDQSVDKLIDNINDALEFRNKKLRA